MAATPAQAAEEVLRRTEAIRGHAAPVPGDPARACGCDACMAWAGAVAAWLRASRAARTSINPENATHLRGHRDAAE